MGLPRLSLSALALVVGCAEPLELGAVELELRPSTPDSGLPPPTYEPGVTVEHLDTNSFRVHYARTGQHAVPAPDANQDGVPDAVQTVASEYERVLAHFRDKLGFLPPRSDANLQDDNGGDGRFDVYLVDFPNSADGSFRAEGCSAGVCTGYMLQENDFDGRGYPSLLTATRILASHELFHAVQNAYRSVPSVVLSEATAVWASEEYDPSLSDFEGFLPAYLTRPDRSLLQEPLGPPDSFSYGAGLFFAMLSEQCPSGLVRALWEELARSEDAWPVALDRVMQPRCGSLADMFVRFARFNLRTGSRASRDEGYANAASYPEVPELPVTLPYHDELLRTLPLSTHYFVADASEPVALWASSGDVRALLAIEGADGTLRTPQSMPANVITPLAASPGERVHAAVVDTRSAGNTLRLQVCLGSPSYVQQCAGLMEDAGVAPEDAGSSPVADAGVPIVDAAVDAAVSVEAGVSMARGDDGCSLGSSRSGYAWLALALALRLRRRRSAAALVRACRSARFLRA
ncbi:MAG: MXAN_6640 family putative metalloprotease [Polyangiales bacterium]